MRKFVNKKRQKRKYTKKAELLESYSFSKTATGMLPLLVMTIVFMATMVISTPFRTAFSHIQFTFQMPDFSFENPLNFLQTIAFDLNQLGALVGTAFLNVVVAINETVTTTGENIIRVGTFLDPRPLFAAVITSFILLGNSLWALLAFIGQGIVLLFSTILHLISLIFTALGVAFGGIITFVTNVFVSIGVAISSFIHMIFVTLTSTMIALWNGISFAALETTKFVLGACLSVVHFISTILVAIWMWFASVINAIVTAFVNAVIVTVRVIEIPFKVLYSFGLILKPYADIFGRHVGMTGADLNNGFASWGKVANLLGATH